MMESCCVNITVSGTRIKEEKANITKIYMVYADNNNNNTYWHILVLPLASCVTLTSYLPLCASDCSSLK